MKKMIRSCTFWMNWRTLVLLWEWIVPVEILLVCKPDFINTSGVYCLLGTKLASLPIMEEPSLFREQVVLVVWDSPVLDLEKHAQDCVCCLRNVPQEWWLPISGKRSQDVAEKHLEFTYNMVLWYHIRKTESSQKWCRSDVNLSNRFCRMVYIRIVSYGTVKDFHRWVICLK